MSLKSSYKFAKVMVNKMKHSCFIPSCNLFASLMIHFMLALNTYPDKRMFVVCKYSLLICNPIFL